MTISARTSEFSIYFVHFHLVLFLSIFTFDQHIFHGSYCSKAVFPPNAYTSPLWFIIAQVPREWSMGGSLIHSLLFGSYISTEFRGVRASLNPPATHIYPLTTATEPINRTESIGSTIVHILVSVSKLK